MAFALKLTPKIESVGWGLLGGAALCALIGFQFGGWMTHNGATSMARDQADKAVIAALAPICVDKFRHAKNADENLVALNAIGYSYEKGSYVTKGGWATLPGSDEPASGVAQACAEMLGKLAK